MRLYVLGDSISIQYGPYLERYLGERFTYARKSADEEAQLNLPNLQGDNGGDSSMVLAFLEAKDQSGGIPADLILLNCGLHDIKTDPQTGTKQSSIETYRANLNKIVEIVRRMGLNLIWVRTTPCDEAIHNTHQITFHRFAADVERYNHAADDIMRAAGVPMVDLFTFTHALGPDLYCDHVHFHEPVRSQQAAYLAGWLEGGMRSHMSNE
jgi:lysophospholipase L1-like esterase